jgi:hypothetical protein
MRLRVSSVCSAPVLKELMLCKYSLEQLHPPSELEWILMTDALVHDYFEGDASVTSTPSIGLSGDHWSSTDGVEEAFFDIVLKKFDVMEASIERCGYAFVVDSDLVFLRAFDHSFEAWLQDDQPDAVLSPDTPDASAVHFNCGMMLIKNLELVARWREVTLSREHFYEQGALNATIAEGRFKHAVFPHSHNFGMWKKWAWDAMRLRAMVGRHLRYQDELVHSLHMHMFDFGFKSRTYPILIRQMQHLLIRCHPELGYFMEFVRDCVRVVDERCVVLPFMGEPGWHERYVGFVNALGRVDVCCGPGDETQFPKARAYHHEREDFVLPRHKKRISWRRRGRAFAQYTRESEALAERLVRG